MTTPRSGLAERLEVLDEIVELADGRLPPDTVARVATTSGLATARLRHGPTRIVAGLAGATGSGKSSLFNALAGAELAATGVRRPTTSATRAGVFTAGTAIDADVAGLLSWLAIRQHDVITDPELDGLVLLDLPDHDSTHADHRREVDRLVEIVDLFVWVVDPQKYADAALHHGYLRRFAGHAEVTVVVLNQIDTLAPTDRTAAIDDLARILVADGLTVARPGGGVVGRVAAAVTGSERSGVRVVPVSARTGKGVAELRSEIVTRVRVRRAAVERLGADLDAIAAGLSELTSAPLPVTVPGRTVAELGDALAAASGADAVAAAVGAAHRHRGAQATGWPIVRWASRFRPDPLRRLGLDRRATDPEVRTDPAGPGRPVGRTNLPAPSSVASTAVSSSIRRVVDDVSGGAPHLWRQRLTTVAAARRPDLDDALDRAIAGVRLPTGRPAWWAVVNVLQWLLAAAFAAGIVWLSVILLLAWLRLPDLPAADVSVGDLTLPVPTVLVLGGALAAWVVAVLGRWATRVGARRRAATARRRLTVATTAVGRELVVEPLEGELGQLARLRQLVGRLRR